MTRRVMLYVQHLLGIGHLMRTARIARALAASGLEVTIASGGMPIAGLDFGAAKVEQLLPLRAGDAGFSGLVEANGAALTPERANARRDSLVSLFQTISPDALITEAFPFGRRQMRFELLPLLDAARAQKTLVLASVRDILQQSRKSGRAEESADYVARYYDGVLVHGDAALARLEETFPLALNFAAKIRYTGLVGPGPQRPVHSAAPADVIISAGGGAVGESLIRCALAARPLTSLAQARWLVLTGPNISDALFSELKSQAAANVTIARFAADLPARLHQTRLSVSQAGYNTVADILQAGCASVLVPYAKGGETEQGERAGRLGAQGLAVVVEEDALDARSLADAMQRALALPHRAAPFALDGAKRTAAIVKAMINARA